MKMKKLLTLAMLLTATVTMAKDIKTLVVTTLPQMHCENCENKIKGNLRFEKGIKKIETNVDKQEVTITYDADKTSAEAIINGFSKFGYKAIEVKGKTEGVKTEGIEKEKKPRQHDDGKTNGEVK